MKQSETETSFTCKYFHKQDNKVGREVMKDYGNCKNYVRKCISKKNLNSLWFLSVVSIETCMCKNKNLYWTAAKSFFTCKWFTNKKWMHKD